MTDTIDGLKARAMRDTPANEDQLRGTCRSCGWPERMAGKLDVNGFCPKCYAARQAEVDREYRAIMSRRRDV